MTSILLTRTGAVAEVVLNRPEKKNALRNADWQLLRRTMESLGAEADPARCVLVRGEGGCFSAGHDLSGADARVLDARETITEYVNTALLAVRDIGIPTIAAVAGPCVGGGLGIAMACDIVLAADDAVIGSPFRNIGIMLDAGGHYFLRDRVGHHKASQIIYTGRMFSGREAFDMGLVCEAYAPDALLKEARALAQRIADGPTAAFAASKRILLEAGEYSETLAREAEEQAEIFKTTDAAEGLAAFNEKRKPVFVGH
jgi:2-(1,2-epoxy-1,2-dihydrophenyl)acetyl-CoA isomerase